ncbi:hypothetical protein TKK_0018912 [Trichogramma kaykai]
MTVRLIWLLASPIIGLGPSGTFLDPRLANLSAISLPLMPIWPDLVFSCWSPQGSLHYQTSFENVYNLCLEYYGQPTNGHKSAPTVSPPVVTCSRQPSGF